MWETAMKLFEDLILEALLPSIVSFNSAINACGNWLHSMAFLEMLQEMALQSSLVTFGALMGKEEMPWKSVSQLLGSITAKHLRTGDLKFQQTY